MGQVDMNDKESFIFRKRYFKQISSLSMEQKAKLLDKICEYQTTWTYEISLDGTDMLMSIMIDEWVEDDEKWNKTKCERSKAWQNHIGNQYTKWDEKRKGREQAQKNSVEQMEQNGTNGTNGTVYVSVSDSVCVNDSVSRENIHNTNVSIQQIPHDKSCSKDSLFEKFWEIYPIKKDKKKAREKFNRLSTEKQQLAIEWVKKLQKSKQRIDGFAPHPTTYINGERREDEVTVSSDEQLKERQIERHRQMIAEQIAGFNSKNNENDGNNKPIQGFDRRTEMNGKELLSDG